MEDNSLDGRTGERPNASAKGSHLGGLLRPGSMVMSSITIEDYESTLWPKLEHAVHHLLTMKPSEYTPISYEQMYTCVYKCVCKQFSERLYSDLISTVTTHLERVCYELQLHTQDAATYITQFHTALQQYFHALQAIVPVFNYMNRFYVEPKLKTDLNIELKQLFASIVADKHIHALLPLLVEANLRPFTILPPVMATLIKNLYVLKCEYANLRPQLFAKYIPNVLPACSLGELDMYVQEAQQMQRDLLTHPDFISGDQSRKRHSDDDAPRIVSASSQPTDYSSV